MIAAAAAFAILGPTLAFLGTLKWGTIFKGLAAIALILGTLAVVGVLAAAPLIVLGAALTVLGLGMLMVSAAHICSPRHSLWWEPKGRRHSQL